MTQRFIDVTMTWGDTGAPVSVKQVPAWVCSGCGEELLEDKVAMRLQEMVREHSGRRSTARNKRQSDREERLYAYV